MTEVKISEFVEIKAWGQYGSPDVDQAVIAIGAASVQSAPFTCENIRITAKADCYIELNGGANPVAVKATSEFFPAGSVEPRKVKIGDRLAVIQP